MARPGAACPPPARRLLAAARALLFWALVYGYCGLCACMAGLRLLWSIGRRPGETFRRAVRENPPACLNDPSLGTHCYVRIKVKARGRAGKARARPRERAPAPCARLPCALPVPARPCPCPCPCPPGPSSRGPRRAPRP